MTLLRASVRAHECHVDLRNVLICNALRRIARIIDNYIIISLIISNCSEPEKYGFGPYSSVHACDEKAGEADAASLLDKVVYANLRAIRRSHRSAQGDRSTLR